MTPATRNLVRLVEDLIDNGGTHEGPCLLSQNNPCPAHLEAYATRTNLVRAALEKVKDDGN